MNVQELINKYPESKELVLEVQKKIVALADDLDALRIRNKTVLLGLEVDFEDKCIEVDWRDFEDDE